MCFSSEASGRFVKEMFATSHKLFHYCRRGIGPLFFPIHAYNRISVVLMPIALNTTPIITYHPTSAEASQPLSLDSIHPHMNLTASRKRGPTSCSIASCCTRAYCELIRQLRTTYCKLQTLNLIFILATLEKLLNVPNPSNEKRHLRISNP